MAREVAVDPAALLARYHARHGVRQLACPVCMRPRVTPAKGRRTVRRHWHPAGG